MAEELLRKSMNAKPSVEVLFNELVARWEEAVKPTIRESTALYYQKMLDAHVLPRFGVQEIAAITRYGVEQFLADKARQGYCRNTLRGMRVSLGRVLTWAVENEWLPKNPCSGVRLPIAGTKIERTILQPDQLRKLVARLAEPYATFVLFLACTGLRVSEAAAIRWSDVSDNLLHVRRRVYAGAVGELKTKSSRRTLPLSSELISRMSSLGPGDYIFRAYNGSPLNPGNAAHRHLRPALRHLGIKLGGWHDFRHTLATQLLRQNSPKLVANILGHSNVRTTLDVYQHIKPEDLRAPLAEVGDQLLANISKQTGSKKEEASMFLN
jgi:integrase